MAGEGSKPAWERGEMFETAVLSVRKGVSDVSN